MPNNNEKVFREIFAAANKAVRRVESVKHLKKRSKVIADDIRERTRKGFGTDADDNPLQRFKKLSEPYKAYRRKNANKLDSTTTPNKSNLTFTGQLLLAIFGTASKSKGIIIDVKKRRFGKGGNRTDNKSLVGYLEDMGRAFLYIAKREKKKLEKILREDTEKEIERELKKL